jgi:hypothetical protein
MYLDVPYPLNLLYYILTQYNTTNNYTQFILRDAKDKGNEPAAWQISLSQRFRAKLWVVLRHYGVNRELLATVNTPVPGRS